jgi:EmrB/QacA subfamily drug resistance transporter
VLSVTTLGSFMAALDSNIVTIALPYMSTALSAGFSLLSWVLVGYLLAFSAFVLQAGKLGDIYGKRKVYLIGFAVFGVASALCGLSPDAYQLVAYRVLQGAGAAILLASGNPLIFASFPPKERGGAVGINSIAYAVGSVAGPVVGGALTAIDWRLIFYVNVPIAVAAIAVGRTRIPAGLSSKGPSVVRLNVLNSTILAGAIASVVLWLTLFDTRVLPFAILGVAAFAVAETKSKNPLLNRDLLKTRGFVYSVVALGLLFASYSGVVFVMSFYFQSVVGISPLTAGLWIAPTPLALAVVNPLAGRMFDRMRRPALLSIAGAILAFASLVLLSGAIATVTPGAEVVLLLAAIGVAGGMQWAPTISSALRFSKQETRGVANGTAFTLVNIGFATSIALVVSISTTALPPSLAEQIRSGSVTGLSQASAHLFDQGLSSAILGMAIVGVAALVFLILTASQQGEHFEA